MTYSEKNSKYFDYSTCLFRLSPPLSEKIRNWLTPPPPLFRKNLKMAEPRPPPLGGWHNMWTAPYLYECETKFGPAFSKNRPLADSFIESRCPYIYLYIYLYICPVSCNFFACNQPGSSIGHACNQTGSSIGHASTLLHAWSLKNKWWVQSVHHPHVHQPRVHLITCVEP